jgi:hypothetical protein
MALLAFFGLLCAKLQRRGRLAVSEIEAVGKLISSSAGGLV